MEIESMWLKHKNNSSAFLIYFCFILLVQHFGRHSNIPEKQITQV